MTVSGAVPEPSRTLAILFGASRWPHFESLDDEKAASTYATAADSFRDYLLDQEGLGLPNSNFLNLFDSGASAIDQDKQIREFILSKCKETATIQDLIVMFIGHGSTTQGNRFIFVLGSTNREQREMTAYKSESLGRTLKDTAPTLRKWVILDCCAAQAAYGDFQPASEAAKVLEIDAETSFPPDGAAFYASCSSDKFAYNDPKSGSRMFTAALTDVLKRGDPALSERLTLSEVASLTLAEINRRHGVDAVRPYIGDPDQRKGELSTLPFFPNAARRTMSVEAQLKSLQSSISILQSGISARLEALDQALGEQKREQDALARAVSERSATSPDAVSDDEDGTAGRFKGLDQAIRTLSVPEQRWWDRASSGYRFSRAVLAVATGLLALQVLLAVQTMISSSESSIPLAVYVQRALAVVSVLIVVCCAPPLFLDRYRFGHIPEDMSPELESLMRTNAHFRKIYCGTYEITVFGLLDRRMLVFAVLAALLATLIGVLTFFTLGWVGMLR